jgi:hypothetical protein
MIELSINVVGRALRLAFDAIAERSQSPFQGFRNRQACGVANLAERRFRLVIEPDSSRGHE